MYDLEKREKLNEIVELMKKNDWQAVLDIFQVSITGWYYLMLLRTKQIVLQVPYQITS